MPDVGARGMHNPPCEGLMGLQVQGGKNTPDTDIG